MMIIIIIIILLLLLYSYIFSEVISITEFFLQFYVKPQLTKRQTMRGDNEQVQLVPYCTASSSLVR